MTQIKICGLFRPEDIAAVNAARPDYAGFILNFPKSHRNLTLPQTARLRALLRPEIRAVGVFVDQSESLCARAANDGIIDIIQLHGQEDDAYIARLCALTNAPIWKAFRIRGAEDLAAAQESSADEILLDNGYGTGECFDWSLAGGLNRPFLLAGGLTPENIPQAVTLLHPKMIDISSGAETDRRKDPDKILRAVAAVRGTHCETKGTRSHE